MTDNPALAPLTAREKRFGDEYAICLNQTEAARLADYKGDRKTLAVTGHRLLRKANVRAYINGLLEEIALSKQEILGRLAAQARGDVGDLLDNFGNLDLQAARENGLTHLIKEIEVTTAVYEDREVHTSKVKIHDPQAALVHLGRAMAMFTDKTEHSGTVNWRAAVTEAQADDDQPS